MKITMCENNVVVENKINNRIYKIVDFDGTRAVANQVDPATGEINSDAPTVTINEGNAIAFRFLNNPNVPEIPFGITVEDGILTRDGQPVTEQGAIKVEAILSEVPGKLLLAVKSRVDDLVDLMSYSVTRDRFNKLKEAVPMPEVIKVISDIKETKDRTTFKVVLSYSKTHMEKVDKDGKAEEAEEVEVFDQAGVVTYDAMTDSMDGNSMYAVSPIMETTTATVGADANAVRLFAKIRDIETGKCSIVSNSDTMLDEESVEVAEEETIECVVQSERGLFIRTSKKMVIVDEHGYIVEAPLAKTGEELYIVDKTRDGYDTIYSLATKDASKVITVTNKSTRDRGCYIVINE